MDQRERTDHANIISFRDLLDDQEQDSLARGGEPPRERRRLGGERGQGGQQRGEAVRADARDQPEGLGGAAGLLRALCCFYFCCCWWWWVGGGLGKGEGGLRGYVSLGGSFLWWVGGIAPSWALSFYLVFAALPWRLFFLVGIWPGET